MSNLFIPKGFISYQVFAQMSVNELFCLFDENSSESNTRSISVNSQIINAADLRYCLTRKKITHMSATIHDQVAVEFANEIAEHVGKAFMAGSTNTRDELVRIATFEVYGQHLTEHVKHILSIRPTTVEETPGGYWVCVTTHHNPFTADSNAEAPFKFFLAPTARILRHSVMSVNSLAFASDYIIDANDKVLKRRTSIADLIGNSIKPAEFTE